MLVLSPVKPEWRDVSENDYFADKSAVNSSSLKYMLKSPNSFKASFFDGKTETTTEALKFGTLAHLAILQGSKFKDTYQVMPKFTGYTKSGELTDSLNCKEVKDKRSAWLAELPKDAVICTEEERDKLIGMVESIIKHPKAFKLLQQGKPEIVGYWNFKNGIPCKMKADFISFNLNALVDLKTTQNCDAKYFSKQIENFRYDFQMQFYSNGIQAITGKAPEHKIFIAIEKEPPYEVAVYEMAPQYEEAAEFDIQFCMDKLKQCLETNEWPSKQKEIEIIEPNHWFMKDYEGVL